MMLHSMPAHKTVSEHIPLKLLSKDNIIWAIDIACIVVITALLFSITYHPYYFGDELPMHRLAISNDYSFRAVFHGLNSYKPRLIANGIFAMLAAFQAKRMVFTAVLSGCMVWIAILIYWVSRHLLKTDRVLAWLSVATVLSSRYGVMLYFDYSSGLVELLSAPLLFSALLLAWLAWNGDFNKRYAAGAFYFATACVFSHERHAIGLLTAGALILLAECIGTSARRRPEVAAWAVSFGLGPLILFWTVKTILGSQAMTVGSAGRVIKPGLDTLWCFLTNSYNVFLGGNYGLEYFWGKYNYLHPVGRIMGIGTVIFSIGMILLMLIRKGFERQNLYLAAGLLTLTISMIAVSSLPGTARQEARWLFTVGIMIVVAWIVAAKGAWRYAGITLMLAVNILYVCLNSHDAIANIYSSRAANAIGGLLQGVAPTGRNGIIVGNSNDGWTIGGGGVVDMGPRQGDTFSRVSLQSKTFVDPVETGMIFDPAKFDFALVFDGFGPHQVARYRLVSVKAALALGGFADESESGSSLNRVMLGNRNNWLTDWHWSVKPSQIDGAVTLSPNVFGLRPVSVSILNGRMLVYRIRSKEKDGTKVPMRLQVNWHAASGNRFISAVIKVVNPSENWKTYTTLLNAPPGADIGYVYTSMHDGAQGEVEVQSVELR